jgi:hypothetical protein
MGLTQRKADKERLKELELLKPLTTTYHIYERKGKRILKKTRWFEMSASGTQRLIPEAKENIEEVRWMAVDELAPVYENTYALVKELLLRFEEKRSRT